MGVYIKGMDKPKRCNICPLCRYYHENGNVWCNALNVILESIPYEMRLLDSVLDSIEPHKDCPLVEVSDSEKPNNCEDEPQTESWHYDEKDRTWYPYSHDCGTCKNSLGDWDGHSLACGRCCGTDYEFYEPKTEPQTEDPPMDEYYKDHDEFYEPQTERSE